MDRNAPPIRRNAPSEASRIRLLRSQTTQTLILVEGTTDLRVYKRFFEQEKGFLIPYSNNEKPIAVLSILEKEDFQGVFALIDRDFSSLDNSRVQNINIIYTDTHDLESMIIKSPALESILEEFGRSKLYEALEDSVKNLLVKAALPIGYLRWLSLQSNSNLNLNFKELNFEDFISLKTLMIDTRQLIETVIGNSSNPTIPKDYDINKTIEELISGGGHDPWDVCLGHDLAKILSIGFIHIFGNERRGRTLTYEIVEGIVRNAYDFSLFTSTDMFKGIREWERNNPIFCCLRDIPI